MHLRLLCLGLWVAAQLAEPLPAQSSRAARPAADRPAQSASYDASVPSPTHRQVAYGADPRHVLDFWQAKSESPTPVVLVIHGGGWKGGEKERVHRFADVARLLEAGISVAACNYRLIPQAADSQVSPPVQAPLYDAARAVQFLRSQAAAWNIDKPRIAAAGGSAGACSSLWLAYHDDLADPDSQDPLARESTRLWCAAVTGAQTSLDPEQMREWTPNSRYGGHAFGLESFDTFLAKRESILEWINEYSPYAQVTADDPPVYLTYSAPPAIGQPQRDPTHTANFGVKLQERCREQGVACELFYPGAPGNPSATPTEYLISSLIKSGPYDDPPAVAAPYYRVRYEASSQPGELAFPVAYTVWIPPAVDRLRGVIVHQHGCGEGSCRSGQTGAFDLHWQALAEKHACALLSPAYEQPEGADCQLWCDPRHGSAARFQQALGDLGSQSEHPELAQVPWALWGHSGGGHWAGGMLLLYPQRIAAVWLRSGVPLFEKQEGRAIEPHVLNEQSLQVPVMCNLGTKEGYTASAGKFGGVWPSNLSFFEKLRGAGGLVGIAVDPLTSHECGNQRYLAIPWFDVCLSARLPAATAPADAPLNPLAADAGWLAPLPEAGAGWTAAVPQAEFAGEASRAVWLPGAGLAAAWYDYVRDTAVADTTPPPAPSHVQLNGRHLSWQATADVESGLAHFLIERDGQPLATVDGTAHRFGRQVFQGLQYSDTPAAPLVRMHYAIDDPEPGSVKRYRVRAVNTVGLVSP